ncbi:vacuolar protein sorting-associated protein 13D [Schistocerca piceifrons]|uniref:vacuolar protein sorting-associated protein 13D n=1 Tax=Schistocerca piceifrons TaxID=274613 RepID=UPI001F5EE07A|nr:vacuolar protein sorting-associated protein 13D [Schistocerca piceifrons]
MLEGLVAWVLNTYLGKYVENLNTDQLSIALLQGEVELENLPLRKDALRQVGLPIQIRSGFIGKVKLQIPVRQIRSAPWVVIIERLYVIAGPLTLNEWNKEAEENADQEYKLYLLDAMEARWRAETETPQEGSYSSWFSYGTGLVTNIVENLQLRIKDVHVRYEDDVTVPGEMFVCGVTIDSLTAQSCDDKWIPRFTNWEARGTSFKLVELNTLALYWDTVNTLLGNLPLDELAVKMSKSSTWEHHFLMSPVSAQAHIKRNRSEQPLRSKTQPRIVCDLQLDEVPLTLVDWQYAQMVGCIKGLNKVGKLFRRQRWRPTEQPSVCPRQWWLYAARCHDLLLPDTPLTGSAGWQQALSRAKDNVQYVKLYSHSLANPGAAPLDKQLRTRIETERSLDELRILREIAMKRVRPPQVPAAAPQTGSGRSVLMQWFPQWWYTSPSTSASTSTSSQQQTEQNPIEDQLLDALADTLENNTLLRRDVVFGQCNFTLKWGTFNLCTSTEDRKKTPFIELQFENVKLDFESRPRTGSHRFDIELGAIYLRDQLTQDSVFPVLIAPQNRPDSASALPRPGPGGRTPASGIQRFLLNTRAATAGAGPSEEPLFSLSYEYKPFVPGTDCRLHIQSQSLDIVYNPAAVKSLVDFFTRPHKKPDAELRLAARHHYEAMKKKTKEELLRNWEQMLEGEVIDRKVWDIELNISAPQIIFLEHFCDKNALMIVVDFGKFHFSNRADLPRASINASQNKESDEEDEFQTPCSTPPGSQTSEPELSQMPSLVLHPPSRNEDLSEISLHQKLYDRYRMELGDLQILVGRVRDNWKYAHLKGTSTLHLLDRFNIAIMLERRRVFTVDPNFPNLALSATLPRLVVHMNENKVQAIKTVMSTVAGGGLLPSPFRSQMTPTSDMKGEILREAEVGGSSDLLSEKTQREVSRLLMLQFTVEHLSIEVQSRGRSIAELQVSGVRASFTKRPFDTSMSLSVHSLLLADALQTFGPDFELLVASHKHVGMDSVSGSLRDSEPTSPTSPGSPDPTAPRSFKATSPIALTQALSSLQLDPLASLRAASPTYGVPSSPPHITSPPLPARPPSITMEPLDAEALITVEILLVSASCPSNEGSGEGLQVASIQFNNLDIIANQETIVELLGFMQTIFPQFNGGSGRTRTGIPAPSPEPIEESEGPNWEPTRTEVTFDFHRLNVLLLRAVVRDGTIVGRKIATATMSQAKILATVGNDVVIHGSLGGLQLLDLTPEGHLHPRILSLGKDPLGERDSLAGLAADLYSFGQHHNQVTDALSFSVCRPLNRHTSLTEGLKWPEIKIRMASVWYTHSPQIVAELQCCVAEFQQYLTNLARSIKSAATEMAIGLVQARTELLAQTFYTNNKLSTSLTAIGSETPSPKRRGQSSVSQSAADLMDSVTSTQTPYSPSEDGILDQVINIKLDIVLDSPVVVLPRCASSYEVFVAHLGKMSLNNSWPSESEDIWIRREYYNIDIKDINVFSLDTIRRGTRDLHLNPDCPPMRAEKLYSCLEEGKPILHDTALRLLVERHCGLMRQQTDNLLLGAETPPEFQEVELHDLMQVTGTVVTQLKISLSRQQYEQLLETVSTLVTPPLLEPSPTATSRRLADIAEEETSGISTLRLEESLHTHAVDSSGQLSGHKHPLTLKVSFDLPVFIAELKGDFGRGEQGLVDLSIRDFSVQFDRSHRYETNIQMCLRSLLMEDLMKEPGDKHRCIVVSSAQSDGQYVQPPSFVSKSCPNLAATLAVQPPPEVRGSLPCHLGTGFRRPANITASGRALQKTKTVEYPCTPPPSPRAHGSPQRMFREDNLMHINVVLVDTKAPNFASFYNSVQRSVTVDFNSLDIVANIESWVVVFDFFSIGSGMPSISRTVSPEGSSEATVKEPDTINSDLEVDVRSVTLVLNLPAHEVACANISNLHTTVRSRGQDTYVDGRLGSMSLLDVSPHSHLYRERFISSGHEALNFTYFSYGQQDVSLQREYDSHLKLEMSTVLYIHTKRFVAEIQAFFHHFSQLRGVMASIRAATTGREIPKSLTHAPRMLLELHAGSPVIMLPVSSLSSDILVADLGRLTVSNSFKMYGSPGTIRVPSRQEISPDASPPEMCLLDVMEVELMNMDLYPGQWKVMCLDDQSPPAGSLMLGMSAYVMRAGPSLLQEKCQLHLQVDRNLNYQKHLWIPDMSVNGKLSAVHAAVDLAQYKLIRGLLTYNIGENVEDLLVYYSSSPDASRSYSLEGDRTLLSILLELENVTLQLQRQQGIPLAGINFIRSRLLLELMNDGSQDIDLASQEILLIDTRFQAEPVNKRSNVFTNILQPMKTAHADKEVQAEVHHRRRQDSAMFTILLKDMRLMAILDWWEAVRNFIIENADVPRGENETIQKSGANSTAGALPGSNTVPAFELKMNITNCEIVLVENAAQWDSSAVILKSNSVVVYRPQIEEKPLSCELNNCELFSCVLDMEDDTALSIIDPVHISIEIARHASNDSVLEIISKDLTIRLSYHDMRMFLQILNSLPKQTPWAKAQDSHSTKSNQPANIRYQVNKLVNIGFKAEDCLRALEFCHGDIDDAAIWLTQNAVPDCRENSDSLSDRHTALGFEAITVETTCLRLVIIDDCRDADVPLFELTFLQLQLKQELGGAGNSSFCLCGDYYNRLLSGWEPFLEPWGCQLTWNHTPSSPSSPSPLENRLNVNITSVDILNVNITSTIVDLFKTVKENWMLDYGSTSQDRVDFYSKNSPAGYRRRSPFVPYALHNKTGSTLWFHTHVTDIENMSEGQTMHTEQHEKWIEVPPEATVPFTYEDRGKIRHRDTHKHTIHQLLVKVNGWKCTLPVSVDKVGVYFRQAVPENQNPYLSYLDVPEARIVFEVTLEGSAKKLVTVRSALVLSNKLHEAVEVKLENSSLEPGEAVKFLRVPASTAMPIPLAHVMSQLWIRPVDQRYLYCTRPIIWNHVSKPGEVVTEHRQCLSSRDLCYRFCVAVHRDNYPVEKPLARSTWLQPGHTITLFSPLCITNLLPYDLHFSVSKDQKFEGHVRPAESFSLHQVDTEAAVEINFRLENFPGIGTLIIPSGSSSFSGRVRVQDLQGRRLYLQISVNVRRGTGYKVSVSVPFWIYNRTGLPLVFRQEGVATDTAGQFDEHEMARMVAPLMFSFADHETTPTVVARIGNKVHPEGIPHWCNHFHLQKGLQVRRLRVALRSNSPDLVYLIGIEVRPGRGRHRVTHIVTLSPRYQLHNMSSHHLLFAQKCFTGGTTDPGAEATYLRTVPDCNLAWHWPRLDKDQLLCVRLPNVSGSLWSGGFQIDISYSLHVNIRDVSSKMYLLRVEIVLKGATYCVVFTDADTMPPPIRIDNLSEVSMQFYQSCISDEILQTVVRPRSCIAYAWDEPTQPHYINLVAPGGASCVYEMATLGPGRGLTYENFIYIAFTGTFENVHGDPLDVRGQQLVLEVLPGSNRVTLAQKEHGVRSQLWRMSSEGLLQHEGSSPPHDQSGSGGLVLDIAGPAPQPLQYVPLVLRRPDARRQSTQTWRFTAEGRLCCAHYNMCVQAKDGFFGLRQGGSRLSSSWQMWNEVVLGPPQPVCHQLTVTGIPIEQAVGRQKLRPGSGFLAVNVLMDGPTTVLQISDLKEKQSYHILHADAHNYRVMTIKHGATSTDGRVSHNDSKEMQVKISLPAGLGLSLVSQHTPAEELLYLTLKEIDLKVLWSDQETSMYLRVRDVQCDNQLVEAQCAVPLYVTQSRSNHGETSSGNFALEIMIEQQASSSTNAEIYKRLMVSVKNLSITIEERLLLKLFLFVGYSQLDADQEAMEESDVETQRLITEASSISTKRYYFGSLRLEPSQIRLSVLTSNKLAPELRTIKRKLGLKLIKFEDAAVDLEPYYKTHQFESSLFLVNSIIKHFKEELKWQAAIILGSVDFLGNPLGLVNDVSEGMSGLIFEGNVTALLRNVTHGLSNSAAKVTGSLSDGLGRVILDDKHEETRQRIRKVRNSSSGEHLVAGLKGLGFGLLGGVTSVFKQTYEGAANDGMQGFISGLGKGLVGTVTKPVVGVLDLASEAASAVRDSSRSSIRINRQKVRETRCVIGTSGLLPPYDSKQSTGLRYLYDINDRNYSELFIAYECLRSGAEDLRILVSSEIIRVFTCGPAAASHNIVLEINLGDLFFCKAVQEMSLSSGSPMYYIELTVRAEAASERLVVLQEAVKKPRVRCDDEITAKQVSHHINYAKGLFEERRNTLVSLGYDILED